MPAKAIMIAVFFVIFLLVGCGDRPAGIAKLPENAVLLAFGDSLTAGTGAGAEHSYPAVLAELTGYKVINSGVPGELSAVGLKRLAKELAESDADLVILCHGGNDILQSKAPSEIKKQLEEMLALIRKSGAGVILIGVPKLGFSLRPPAFYEEIADSLEIPYDGGIIGAILADSSLRSDYVHPNAKGYRKLSERVAQIIRDSQATGP